MGKIKQALGVLLGRHNERGEEILDPTPVEVPLRFKRPESMQEKMRRMIAVEMSRHAEAQGMESFDEADDFEIEDEVEPWSPHELTFMQEEFSLRDASNLDAKGDDNGEGNRAVQRSGKDGNSRSSRAVEGERGEVAAEGEESSAAAGVSDSRAGDRSGRSGGKS